MRRIRAAGERGTLTDAGDERRCAFSSGDFHDPGWTGFGVLRVLNEHRLAPGAGPVPPRANMEELVYVLAGSVSGGASADGPASLGPGALYWTGAGHGAGGGAAPKGWVAGPEGAVVLQAWIRPDRVNAAPSHGWRAGPGQTRAGWRCLAAPGGTAGAFAIRQQAWLRAGSLAVGGDGTLSLDPARRYWLQVLEGTVAVDGTPLRPGDGLAITDEGATPALRAGDAGAELLLFDLPH